MSRTITAKTPEDESEHLPPDDETDEDLEEEAVPEPPEPDKR